MPLNANTAPYYDDYDPSKQYYQIMFNPGRPVQARELTQLQTMLQKQIERMGDHIFQHGARVLGAQSSYAKCKFVKLADYEKNDSNEAEINLTNIYDTTTLLGASVVLDSASAGNYGTDADGNTITPDGRAPVGQIIYAEARDGDDPATLLLTYETEDEFAANDFIKTLAGASFSERSYVVNATPTSTSAAVGDATYSTVTSGVFYIKSSTGSHFTYCNAQRIPLSKYTNTPTYKVGLKINESFVTETDDSTLYDNAGGTSQPTAPGAHRLKIDLELATAPGSDGLTISDDASDDFVELLRVENGSRTFSTISQDSSSKIYSAIGNAMADRTYDASGNYVVEPFECRVEETNPPSSQLKVTVQPARGREAARAYVKGREFEMVGPWTQLIEKARDTAVERDLITPTPVGSYVVVRDLKIDDHLGEGSSARTGLLPLWDLHTVNSFQVDSSGITEYNSTRIGSFRLRDLKNAGRFANGATSNVHAVYLQDFKTSNALTGAFTAAATTLGDGTGAKQVTISLTGRNTSTNAYIGSRVSIVSSESHSDYANQTRVVIASSTGGVLTLDQPFDQPTANTLFPGQAENYSLVLEPTAALVGNGSIVPSPYRDHDLAIGGANLNLNRVRTGNAEMLSTAQNANSNPIAGGSQPALLFPLSTGGARVANSIDSSVTEGDVYFLSRYNTTSQASGTTVTFDIAEYRLDTGGSFSAGQFIEGSTSDNFVVINEATGAVINGEDISSFTVTTTQVSVTSNLIGNLNNIRLIGPALINNLPAKKKYLKQGVNTQGAGYTIATDRTTNGHVVFATPNRIPGESDNLGAIDVYRISGIYDTGDPNVAPLGSDLNLDAKNITNQYVLDDGQREDMYDYASVTLKAGAPGPLGQIVVVYDWFDHTDEVGTEGGYFSIDSYNNQVSLENVPSFESKTTGIRYNLKDFLDFRPSRVVSSTGAANTSYFVPVRDQYTKNGARGAGQSGIGHVDASGAFYYFMQYFAPRFDAIVIGDRQTTRGANTGALQIVSGSTNKSPATQPKVAEQDMALFKLAIPSYTKRSQDVIVTKEDNKRYTMRDIGAIANRVDRLEYFSSMNTIEQEMAGIKLVDGDGIEKYKNGFLVDTFDSGLAVADVGLPGAPNPDFNASVGRGMLRPAVEQEHIELAISDSDSTNIYRTHGQVMMPYTTTSQSPGLTQTRATEGGGENVNPFQIQAFYGEASLSPSSDNWHSTLDLNASTSDTANARRAAEDLVQQRIDRGEADVTWGSWEDVWFGEEITTTSAFLRDPEGAYQAVLNNPPPIDPWLHARAMVFDDAGNYIHSPTDGYTYRSNDETGARPGIRVLNNLSASQAAILPSHPNGIIDYVRIQLVRDGSDPFFNVARQIRVTDEELTSTVTTQDVRQQRRGTYNQFNLVEDRVLVDDRVLSSVVAPYMRPVDITFRARRMKPRTTIYPMFDNELVTNYTERANELILRNTSGSDAYSNPFGDLGPGEEEVLGDSSNTGIGIAVGTNTYGNTVYLVSANGIFVPETGTINRSRNVSAPNKTVVAYKSFSGTVQVAPSSPSDTALTIDDSAKLWWHTTSAGTRASEQAGGSLDVDLYGRKVYLVDGRGYGQNRTIVGYSNTSGQLTLDSGWTLTPNTQTRYSIGEHFSDFSGSAYGVFHLPNYAYANRTSQLYVEGATVSGDEHWSVSAESDERTNDTLRFQSGTKVFSLRSTPNPLESDVTTHVEVPFVSSGAVDTRQYESVFSIDTVVVSVDDFRTENRTILDETVATGRVLETGDVIKYFDPVAQSFIVDPNFYPEGIFIDSVDLWFQTKHNDEAGTQLPITLEIRPQVAGVPHGGKVIAKKSLLPSEVNVLSGTAGDTNLDSTTSTNFKFDRPVKLKSGNEYAIVLVSDSLDYVVWTAEIGQPQLGTGGDTGVPARIVDAQPHLGSFFKSQNGVTWTPEQNQDLAFVLNKCVFTPGQVATAIWKSVNAHSTPIPSFARVGDPLNHVNYATQTGSAPIGTPHQNNTQHKLWQVDYEFDEFRIDTATVESPSTEVIFDYDCVKASESLVPNVFDLEFDETDGYQPVTLRTSTIHPTDRLKILKDKTGSFVLRGTFTTTSRDVSPVINLERLGVSLFRNQINDGGLHANTWPYSRVMTDNYSGGNTVGGGFAIKDRGRDYLNTDTFTLDAPSGKIGTGASGTLVTNGTGSIVGFSLANAGNTYLHSPDITITTGTGTGADIEYVGEDKPYGPGNYVARYVTKKIRLEPGFESRDIRVFLTAASPPGTQVHVYAKVRSDKDDQAFSDKSWQLLARGQDGASELTPDRGTSRELIFRGSGDDDQHPLAYVSLSDNVDAGEGERYTDFAEFAIKIVLQSADTRIVPVVYDLRAIAVS